MLSRLAAAALGRAAASTGRGCLLASQQQQCAPHRRRGVEHVGEWFAARRHQVREARGEGGLDWVTQTQTKLGFSQDGARKQGREIWLEWGAGNLWRERERAMTWIECVLIQRRER
jgi:hypothetical protein